MNNVPEWYARKLMNEQPGDHLKSFNTSKRLAKVVNMEVAVTSYPRRQLLLYGILPVFAIAGVLLALLILGVK